MDGTKAIAPFVWSRCTSGYVIEPGFEDWEIAGEVVTTGLPEGRYEIKSFAPPEDLFLRFMDLAIFSIQPRSQEALGAVREFADLYGLLGLPPCMRTVEGATVRGEHAQNWLWEAAQMRQAVDLWNMVGRAEKGDARVAARRELAQHIRRVGGKVVYDSHPDLPIPPHWASLLRIEPETKDEHSTVPRMMGTITEQPDQFRADDTLRPARWWLQSAITSHLARAISGQLEFDGNRDFRLVFSAGGLLEYMWLQFAQAAHGSKLYRQCAVCSNWIIVSPEGVGARLSRITCSNACRMRAYAQRIEDARRLHAKGVPVAEIVKRVGATDIKTVKGWLGSQSKKKRAAKRGNHHARPST